MAEIIGLRFKREGKQYYFDPQGQEIALGAGVIVETSWGVEFGECVRANSIVPDEQLVAPLRPIVRLATAADLELVERNRKREKEAFGICQRKVADHKLDMKLVDVEYSFEGTKILFFFTSEGRVDFRALVKDLAAIFHSRIELRQIGVRDEAKMIGGLGICGRPFCCSSFLREFQPVSIKMAKTQSLSLNPVKISGTCGRLMCCLKYEQDAYEDLLRNSPKSDSFVETPDGVGDIISINLLRERVRVRLDNASDAIKVFHNSEIRVIRSGKGKRPDDYRAPSPEVLEKLRRVQKELLEEVRRPDSALQHAIPESFGAFAPETAPSREAQGDPNARHRRGNQPNRRAGAVPKSAAPIIKKSAEVIAAPMRPIETKPDLPRHSAPAPHKEDKPHSHPPKDAGDAKKRGGKPYWRKKAGNAKPRRHEGE